ncbi:electron transfer flavoprotein subunit alpha/FixB family protein [Cellvibrio sp. NN19]|uniref:electron transfer flavoprotein subunit alpha/FixB family protein n=1 Tax=Cellvibrio chitinivorans TaxID=3102792 RepID=UPI002B404374|nr:FAD-binding protein [Cellvibrio sp. NN19]
MTQINKSQFDAAVLVLIEQGTNGFSSINFKVMGAVEHLREFKSLAIDLLVVGQNSADVIGAAARIPGIRKVLVAQAESCEHTETLAPWLANVARDYAYVVVGASSFGRNLLPSVAALLDIQPITDVIAIESANSFTRPIYAGSALERVQSNQSINLLSIRASAFDAVQLDAGVSAAAPVVAVAVPEAEPSSRLIRRQPLVSERPELTSARIVVAGGGGLQTGEGVCLLHQLADKLGAGVGASRAAVDAGFIPSDMQVGQTGKVVAPDLYIAVGVSGAVQHLAGMRDSRVVVAINKDPYAPIFQAADYGLVGDLFEVVPQLIESL